MRTHQQIVKDRGASALGRDLVAMGLDVKASTPQRWADRDSIPGEYWAALVELDAATLDELAGAADARQQATQDAAA